MNQLYKFLKLSDIPIFSANFICDFYMDMYPFDTHTCYVNITLDEKQIEAIR